MRILSLGAVLLFAVGSTARGDDPPDLYDVDIVRTINLTFYQSDWWQQLLNSYGTNIYVEGDLEMDGVLYRSVGVRLRGQLAFYTRSQYKKPFKIKMDAFVPGQELLGYDTLRLNNASEDPAFCREVVMSELLSRTQPMMRYNFLKMTINGGNWGIYVNEQTKDRRWAGQWYQKDTGNRYKFNGGNLNYLGPDPPPYMAKYVLRNDDSPSPWYDLIELCDVLNNTPEGPPLTDALWPILDIDETIWEIAGDNVFGNLDSYYTNANNFFVVHDDYHDLMQLINHDLNLSFGTWDGQGPMLDPYFKFDNKRTPLVKHMFKDDRLKREYTAHVRTLAEELFDWAEVIRPMVTKLQDMIRAEVYADTKKIFSNQQFEDGVTKEIQGEWFKIPGLRPYVRNRQDFLLNYATINLPRVSFEKIEIVPELPTALDTVTVLATMGSAVTVREVELRFRVVGPFHRVLMQDDGMNGDGAAGDGVYGALIPPQKTGSVVQFYFVGESELSQSLRFEPSFGAHRPRSYRVDTPAPLKLNEVLAINNTGLSDERGDREDWVEILNAGGIAVEIGGMYLTDDLGQPTAWKIPDGTLLPAGWRLLVWCDDEPFEGPFHATFKLSADGEQIGLFDKDGATLIDGVSFGAQQADVALGRLFDAHAQWVGLLDPTPGASNTPSCGARRYTAFEVFENPVSLEITGVLKPGSVAHLAISGGAPSAVGVVFWSTGWMYQPLDPGVLLVDLTPPLLIPLNLDSAGSASADFTIPDDPAIVGTALYLQHLSVNGSGPADLSNAVELRVCK